MCGSLGARWAEKGAAKEPDLLMDGLKELTLVFPNPALVWLLHQPGVFVDEPRLPENVCRSVFDLRSKEKIESHCFMLRLAFFACL